jgi:delta 1-pyrroline-5-carboxylate dehydrogenase
MTKTQLEAPTTTAERERAAKSMAARLSNKLVIGGKLVDAITRETFPVENPATTEVIGHAPRCGKQDVEQAVATAQSAFAIWSAIPARQRSAIMLQAAQRLEHESETLATIRAGNWQRAFDPNAWRSQDDG